MSVQAWARRLWLAGIATVTWVLAIAGCIWWGVVEEPSPLLGIFSVMGIMAGAFATFFAWTEWPRD